MNPSTPCAFWPDRSWIALLLTMLITLLGLSITAARNVAAQDTRQGSIRGVVTDAELREPLVGVNIRLADSGRGTTTGIDGAFAFDHLPVGRYELVFSYVGYEPLARPDVIVRSGRTTFLEIELQAAVFETDEVTIRPDYFPQAAEQPSSVTALSGEEIRRAPGSAGDISRVVFGLPSVAKVNDTQNSLIVRGGGPTENGFYIDNIEIPNINHFPEQGSSGGPIGVLNVDLIRDVEFHAGGFGAAYGDRLSSIMDIEFRRGNQRETDLQLDLNLAGAGIVGEGPLPANGSYVVSFRRSFLDFIVGAIEEDETSIPKYYDLQGKLYFELSGSDRLSVINIHSSDRIGLTGESAVDTGENLFMDFSFASNTAGANWTHIWGGRGHSETSLSNTWSRYDFQAFETKVFDETGEEIPILDIRPTESEFRLRNVNHLVFGDRHSTDVGVEAKHTRAEYENYYGPYRDELGNPVEAYRVDQSIRATKLFAFATHRVRATPRLTFEAGLRLGHYTYNDRTHVSPRVSSGFEISSGTSVHASAGLYRQFLPLPLLAQNDANRSLQDPAAWHFILGLRRQLTGDTRLTLEVYDKEYRHFPLDTTQPQVFVIDQVLSTGLYTNGSVLTDDGRGYTRGVEAILQKKLARDVYGLVSGAYFRSRYRDFVGVWRDRAFDNRITFQAEGGFKPNDRWEFSLRWLYGGGRPYTPFDMEASTEAARGILDVTRFNDVRLPAYHAMNVRFDRRFNYRRTSLVWYVSVWNAYGRTNISAYEWDELDNSPEPLEQWGLLPIFGLEMEF